MQQQTERLMEKKQPVVLQILPAMKTGGVERGTIEMTKALTHAGWKAVVVSSGGPHVPSIAYAGGVHVELPVASKKPWVMWCNIRKLRRVIKEHQVDIVHARSRAPAWSAYFAAKKTQTHFITTFHGAYNFKTGMKRRYNAVMTYGERVIAVSQFIARHIRENYDTDTTKIRVVHRGVDIRQFDPVNVHPARIAELTNKWSIPEHLPVILFPGRITRWKGQREFIEALARLPHRDFVALLVGDDTGHEKFHDELEKLIEDHHLSGHVRFVGATPHMPEAYTLSRLVIATSIEPEAFGRVALEAQAMGRPVIATKHGGACETVIPTETGWLIIPGDISALTNGIEHALALDEEHYQQMAAAGILNAANFTTAQMCDRVMHIYDEIIST